MNVTDTFRIDPAQITKVSGDRSYTSMNLLGWKSLSAFNHVELNGKSYERVSTTNKTSMYACLTGVVVVTRD